MTVKYQENAAEEYGPKFNGEWWYCDGIFITPEGNFFDVDGYSRVAHCYGLVIPFFAAYLYPDKCPDKFSRFIKEQFVEYLSSWLEPPIKYPMSEPIEATKMKLALAKFFVNVYKSELTILEQSGFGDEDYSADLSQTIGQTTHNQGYDGHMLMKDILVRSCNYDAIESQVTRTITTSKNNIFETYYDYMLMGFDVKQIPKMIYDEQQQRYIDYQQSDFLISDKEKRLEQEVQAIKRLVPINQRHNYFKGNYEKDSYR